MNSPPARDRFVLDLRPPKPRHDPWRHQGILLEDERTAGGGIVRSGTVFLTGRECPWRCVMCDLWRYTTAEDTPPRSIAAQVAAALDDIRAAPARVGQIKLYNAGSFFDPRAVPECDYEPIAAGLADLERVVVESHPALIGRRVDRFIDALYRNRAGKPPVRLEVAMGLETAHPGALDGLNKRMSVGDFARAAGQLRERGVDVRVFLLIFPPFVLSAEQDSWLLRSIDVAFACGASVVSLIPTRAGNGALDVLAGQGQFREPALDDIERSLHLAIEAHAHRGRIFVDLWDLKRFSRCVCCFDARRDRLAAVNLEQRSAPPPSCRACGAGVRA